MQLTKEQAIAFFDAKKWESMSLRDRAFFQMEQNLLCMPFDKFHEAMEHVLCRPVWTHEFGLNRDGLMAEMTKDRPAPTFDDILALLPADKTVLVVELPEAPKE
jgi:hypothetical protein